MSRAWHTRSVVTALCALAACCVVPAAPGADLTLEVRRDLAHCRANLWRIASSVAQLTDVRDRTVDYVGPDKMIDLNPEEHA